MANDGQEAQIRGGGRFPRTRNSTMAPSTAATARPIAVLRSPAQGSRCCWRKRARWTIPAAAARLRVSASAASSDVPDFLSSDWSFSAEEAVQYQLESLKYNDHPRQDYGIEIMYEFAEFDPFERTDLNRGFGFEDIVRRVGSWWDGYWLTESLINDGDAFSCDIAH
ncbi:hypothetical protein PR202_ga06038 [Eleusine coracana subsp. coracana]|uniref:Uncharacterized protein n=1 Tax=Eleusine coracana subsp. coracana TaxID=191504 RepID=A0AAV5BWG4_ELECO|nr:hypothetical protein PR202_ga06038 [Eleusine coracana subsp. coracana]